MIDYIKAADPNLAWGAETSGWKQPALRPQRPSRSGKLSTTVRPPASAPPPTGRGHHPHRDRGVNRERPRARRRLVRTKKRRDYKANYSRETSLTSARTTEPALIRQVKRFNFNKRTSVSFTLTYIYYNSRWTNLSLSCCGHSLVFSALPRPEEGFLPPCLFNSKDTEQVE